MTIPTVSYRNTEYKLVFHSLFRLLTPAERCRLEDAIDKHEIWMPVLVYDSLKHGPNCVIDGANRLTIGAAKRKQVPINHAGQMTDQAAKALAVSLNRDRRHRTPEEQEAAREERIERVAEAREEGLSIRAIAEAEEISPAQVQRDLQAAGATVPPGTVTGRDNRTYTTPKSNGHAKPSWFVPGGKKQDVDHPFHDVLSAFTHLSGTITKAMNRDGGEVLQAILSHPKIKLVVFGSVVIENGERKENAPKFRGFPGLRRVIRVAGKSAKRKKPMTPDEVWAVYCQKDEDEE